MIRIFIGYDSKLPALFHVFSHSIHARASVPVSVTPLMLSQLGALLTRERNPLQATEFSFSRFLTPHLSNYEGWSIFADNDIIARDDIAKLWALRDERYAVMVVKHNQQAKDGPKFLNMPQTAYEKKNWSAVMLFNNAKCRALTPDYVNTATGLQLHQFKWLEGDHLIGELPAAWNHLVDYDPKNPDAKFVHYTQGGPYFQEYFGCEYTNEWFAEKEEMLKVAQRGQ
jgi:lipopolysaccharide biosynthesis glycosyltransferase